MTHKGPYIFTVPQYIWKVRLIIVLLILRDVAIFSYLCSYFMIPSDTLSNNVRTSIEIVDGTIHYTIMLKSLYLTSAFLHGNVENAKLYRISSTEITAVVTKFKVEILATLTRKYPRTCFFFLNKTTNSNFYDANRWFVLDGIRILTTVSERIGDLSVNGICYFVHPFAK